MSKVMRYMLGGGKELPDDFFEDNEAIFASFGMESSDRVIFFVDKKGELYSVLPCEEKEYYESFEKAEFLVSVRSMWRAMRPLKDSFYSSNFIKKSVEEGMEIGLESDPVAVICGHELLFVHGAKAAGYVAQRINPNQ